MQKDRIEIITNPVIQPETEPVECIPEPCAGGNIQNSIEQLDSSLVSLGCGITIMRCDYTIKYQSRLMRERFGELPDGKCYSDYLNQSQPCDGCKVGKSSQVNSTERLRIKAKDGICYQLLRRPLKNPDGSMDILELFQEMIDEKTTGEKVTFFTGIVNHTPESVIATDQKGKIVYLNPETEKMYGYSSEELLGEELEILTTELYQERIQNEIFKAAVSGRVWNGELLNRRKDGKLFYVSTSVCKMADKEGNFIALVWFMRDITQTKRYQEEMIKIEQEKAETLRILHENEAAINRSLNRAKRELQEKNLELEKRTFELEGEKGRLREAYEKLNQMQAQLIQSEKLASLGQLSAGVAHELNNPISFVHSNLGTLGEYVKDIENLLNKYAELEKLLSTKESYSQMLDQVLELKGEIGLSFILEDFDKIINESKEGIQRVKTIVQDLKDFSYRDKGEVQLADINQGIDSALNIVWNELKYKAEVIKEYGEIPKIECFPQQLNQVFMNILMNAAQAIETKGEIRIKTCKIGDEVVVEISDTGAGIPEENLKHIFEPFFTTKEVGKGTGLGLSVVYGIIQNHKGKIEVQSQISKGSVFKITLPIRNASKPIPGKET
jgi:PAS domain S-box-containing protein